VSDALEEIQRLAKWWRFRLSRHALVRMAERTVKRADVRHALLTAKVASWQTDCGCWRVSGGHDLDGDDLVVIAAIEDDLVIITVF
jgi:hypothetical protein